MNKLNLLLIILCMGLAFYIYHQYYNDIDIVPANPINYEHIIDSINDNHKQLELQYDSMILHYESEIQSLIIVNNNNSINYEKAIENMDNVNIVSNDSITMYISSRIYNK